ETQRYQPRRHGGGGGGGQRGHGVGGGRGPGGQGNGATSGAGGQTGDRKGPDPVQETRGQGGPNRRRSPDPVITTPKPDEFQVQLPGVANGGAFPIDATCDGMGVAPALAWKNAPAGTKAFALAMHHQPPGDEAPHVYWVVTGIPANATGLKGNDYSVGRPGANTIRRQPGYAPPCSQGPGKKWYTLTLFALASEPDLPAGAITRDQLLNAVDGKTLGTSVMHLSHRRTSGNN
ncbi:MAG: YbhB/YbcL family Raf kinase inhibitor-like protein, partial [Armatimonadaceae bacterium]